MRTTEIPVRSHTLSRGEVVTLLVGLGLDLQRRHETGEAFGPVHPAHVLVDARGRPRLVSVEPPAGWTAHDDWVGLLRFGRAMGRPDQTGELSWWSAGRREGPDLLRWLMEWATPEPLGQPASACGSRADWRSAKA